MSWAAQMASVEVVLAAVVLAGVAIAWSRARLDWPRRRRRLALALRLCWVGLVLAALFEPMYRRSQSRPWTTVLVEQGPRVGAEGGQSWAEWSEQAGSPQGDLDVIWFGGEDGLDLRAAWMQAELRRPPGRSGPVLIFGGTSGPGPPVPHWEAARRYGRTVSWIAVDPPPKPDAAVVDIRAPQRLRPGEPFAWDVVLEAAEGVEQADLEVVRGGFREPARTVTFTHGRAVVTIPDRAVEEPWRSLAATVRATGDLRPQNDHLTVTRPVAQAAPVVWLTDQPAQVALLGAALRAEGLRLDVWEPARLPDSPDSLPPDSVLVLDNIPASALPERFQEALGGWLQQGRGGLVVIGGDRSLGPGGYRDTPLASWLPVEPRFERDEERPVVALVLVLDRSGSMAGEKLALARTAALAAAEALAPRDLIGVITFDAEAQWLVEPTAAADRAGLRRRMETVTAGGGTAIAPALALAAERLPGLSAGRRHLILLTDGISQPGPMEDLVRRLAAAGVTTSTVGVGHDADPNLLTLLAGLGGGRFYNTPDPGQMPQIFTLETERIAQTGFREDPFVVQPGRRARWMEDATGGQAPPLLGYALTTARPGADVWLRAGAGDPLLASWRVGLGRAAVFTSDARARWAQEWLKWERFGAFWAGILRHVQPPGRGAVENLRAVEVAAGWKFAWEPESEALNGMEPVGLLARAPDGSVQRLELEEVWPGRWEVEMETRDVGMWTVEAVLRLPDGGEQHRWAAEVHRREPGAVVRPADRRLLAEWARAGGGVVDPGGWADLPQPGVGVIGRVGFPLEPWLWALALALFVIDLWWRRRPVRITAGWAGGSAKHKEPAS